MKDEKILENLRINSKKLTPVELANLLDKLTDGGLTQSSLIFYFKQAFPAIPLKILIDSGEWNRVSDGELSDNELNELLNPWINK